jgi:hypothetical protein
MSNTYHYADNHIFTSRNNSPTITLKPGNVGETLVVQGSISGNLAYTANSDDLGGNALGSSIIRQEPDVYTYPNQGTSVSISEYGSDVTVAFGCVFNNAANQEGGVSVFRSHSGGEFIRDAVFASSTTTTDQFSGLYSDISETGNVLVFCNDAAHDQQLDVYRRDGSYVWNPTPETLNGAGVACKISYNYLVTGRDQNAVDVYLNTGTFNLQQTLLSESGSPGQYVTIFDIIDGLTCAILFGTNIKKSINHLDKCAGY